MGGAIFRRISPMSFLAQSAPWPSLLPFHPSMTVLCRGAAFGFLFSHSPLPRWCAQALRPSASLFGRSLSSSLSHLPSWLSFQRSLHEPAGRSSSVCSLHVETVPGPAQGGAIWHSFCRSSFPLSILLLIISHGPLDFGLRGLSRL